MRITDVQIHSVEHATAHGVSVAEIEQVFFNGPDIRKNRKDQNADYIARGRTDGGLTVLIPFDKHGTTAWVYSAWREGR